MFFSAGFLLCALLNLLPIAAEGFFVRAESMVDKI